MLAEDETDLMMFPPLRAVWSRKGEPAEVHISGRNARRVIFGTMNLMTGTRLFLPGRLSGVPQGAGAGTWPWTSKASVRAAEGMTLLWLPKRSPELNPMDTLWGQGKDVIAANKQYATIDAILLPVVSAYAPLG
ncbi:MAG: transposase [Isosphaeraceae bacterium]